MQPMMPDSVGLIYDDELGEWRCSHVDAYIEPACCSATGSSGLIDCDCGGRDQAYCPNPQCTGLTDRDIDRIFDAYELFV